jgi:hypothetical protein
MRCVWKFAYSPVMDELAGLPESVRKARLVAPRCCPCTN